MTTNNDLALIEDVEIRQPEDIAKMDDELLCPRCNGVICDVESGDSLGLLARTPLDHLAVCAAQGAPFGAISLLQDLNADAR